MRFQLKALVVSATYFDFENEKKERVAGTKIVVAEKSEDPAKCRGQKLTTYNAPIEVFNRLPMDLPKEIGLTFETTGKTTRVEGLA